MSRRYQNIASIICLIVAIGFFLYGLINNAQAKMQKELALKVKIEWEECKKNAAYATKVAEAKTKQLIEKENQLMKALEEVHILSKATAKRK